MYGIVKIKDVVRIPPSKFNRPLNVVAREELASKYEGAVVQIELEKGKIAQPLAIIIAILNTYVDPAGKIIPNDGATYHDVVFDALVFHPFIKEVVEGKVETVAKTGLYVNLGILDGFIHINQVSDERVHFDTARGVLLLEESKRVIEREDVVRAKIYTMGPLPGKGIRIHMTMRQPWLGKIDWLRKKK
ncbi:MAG: DNA-directed RNA polymerase [Desulfurococcaceae archaeon]